jgi:histidinol-phosphate aminotransferase
MTGPRLTPLVNGLPATVPFIGPEAIERRMGRRFAARLGANESAFGPSPAAVEALARAAREAWMYGDPEMAELRAALAERGARLPGISPGHIIPGEGIDGLLGLIVRLTVAPGDPVVTSAGTYPTFAFHVAAAGGALHAVPYAGDRPDLTALARAARRTRAKLVYLANPDNPTGAWHEGADIVAMVDSLGGESLLVLDEAYIDFAPPGASPAFPPDDPRVIRLRTFSKAYGLAGLRVGYGIGAPPLVAAFEKLRNHFGLGRVAQAGALAALTDQDWIGLVRAQVAAAKDEIARIARSCGLAPLPSATNFVTVDCGGGGALARALVAELAERGVFVRMPMAPPLDRCIRISAGKPEDLAVLEAALPGALAAARAIAPP